MTIDTTNLDSGEDKVKLARAAILAMAEWMNEGVSDEKVAPSSKLYNRIHDVVSVRDFGAVGDGETDDTEAIQTAITAAASMSQGERRAVWFPKGLYKVTGGLSIPDTTSHLTLYGESSEGIGASAIYFYHPGDASVTVLIDAPIQNFTMLDLAVRQMSESDYTALDPVTAVRTKRPTTATADTDTIIERCCFKQFSKGIENWGRGLKASYNVFDQCGECIELEWPDVGDYAASAPAISQDTTGFRAFRIQNNRFHSIGTIAVKNSGANASKIHAIDISGNMLDIGRRLFEGVLVDGQIVNNQSIMTPTKVIVLQDGSKNYVVSGLVMAGNTDASRIPDYFIEFTGTHTNGQISNVTMDNCSIDAIRASTGSVLNGVTFNGISCGTVGSSSNNVIRLVGNSHKVAINGLTYYGPLLTEAVRVDSGSVVSVSGYASLNSATPLSVSGAYTTKDVVINGSNVFQKFVSQSGTELGSLTYENAGTNGITLVSSDGSINFKPSNNSVRPFDDNLTSLGMGSRRYSVVYAGTGTINTSDAEDKEEIREVDEAVTRAVRKISFKQFKFKDAVARKGAAARTHAGVIAQEVKAAFESEGLDPFAWGVLCYDEWPEEPEVRDPETGEVVQEYRPAGSRYGVRYDQLLCLKLASM